MVPLASANSKKWWSPLAFVLESSVLQAKPLHFPMDLESSFLERSRQIEKGRGPWSFEGSSLWPVLSCVVVVQSFKHVWLFSTPWTSAHQASLSFTISQSLLKLMSTESVMPSNHLILCHPLLLLPSIFPSVRVVSNELALWSRWPKY